jgi:hypothetical protein
MPARFRNRSRLLPIVLAIILPPLAAAPMWLAAQPAVLPPPIQHGDIVIELETVTAGLNYPRLCLKTLHTVYYLFFDTEVGRYETTRAYG